MRASTFELGAWTVGVVLLGVSGYAVARAALPPADRRATVPAAPRPSRAAPDSVASWAARFAERNPFRFDRRPAAVRFGETPRDAPASAPPKPALLLLGTMGPPWQAVVGGFPGHNGNAVVRSGDRVRDFEIRRVARDTVVIEGMDTTWTLIARRPGS